MLWSCSRRAARSPSAHCCAPLSTPGRPCVCVLGGPVRPPLSMLGSVALRAAASSPLPPSTRRGTHREAMSFVCTEDRPVGGPLKRRVRVPSVLAALRFAHAGIRSAPHARQCRRLLGLASGMVLRHLRQDGSHALIHGAGMAGAFGSWVGPEGSATNLSQSSPPTRRRRYLRCETPRMQPSIALRRLPLSG